MVTGIMPLPRSGLLYYINMKKIFHIDPLNIKDWCDEVAVNLIFKKPGSIAMTRFLSRIVSIRGLLILSLAEEVETEVL